MGMVQRLVEEHRCMGIRFAVLLMAGLIVILFVPQSLSADVGGTSLARKLGEEGESLAKSKKYSEAVAKFRQAYEADANPVYLYGVASALEEMGELGAALVAYNQYIDDGFDESNLKEVKQKVVKISTELKKTRAEVRVFSFPLGAQVYLDDQKAPTGETPLFLWLPFGTVKLRIEMEGYQTQEQTLELKTGVTERIMSNLVDSE